MPEEAVVVTTENQSEGTSFEAFKAARHSEVIPTAESETKAPPAEVTETKTAEVSDTSKEQELERDESGKFKPKEDSVQRRIDKAIAKQRDAERRAEDAERRLAEHSAKPAEEVKAAATEDAEPSEANYTDYNKFVRDLAKWEARQLIAAERKADSEARTKADQAKVVKDIQSAYQESEHQAKEAHDDYAEVLESVADIIMPPAAQIAILNSDSKAELAYYLAKDRAELERIAGLPPQRIAFELGKIEAKLDASRAPVKAEKKVTAAPKPPKPVGGAGVSSTAPEDASSFGDYKARRQAQLASQ